MKKPPLTRAGTSPLVPGVVYEISPTGPTPLGPHLGSLPVPEDRTPTKPGESGLARFGFDRGAEPVPGYQLVARIGEGKSGEVWQASGPGGFALAMKFVGLGDRDADDERHSLSLMRDVRHADLMAIFGVWELDGLLVVGMELAESSLLRRCDEAMAATGSGIPFRELLDAMQQVARGLDFLNRPWGDDAGLGVGLAHRDIKSSNLYMVGGRVKLGDFGRVAALEEPSFIRMDDDTWPDFIPPEWFEGHLDRRSDQYALAMTYYRLRTGQLPRAEAEAGFSPDQLDLTILTRRERKVLVKALDRDPARRWPDCSTFVRELGRSASLVETIKAIPRSRRVAREPVATKSSRGHRRLAGAAVLGLAGLSVLVARDALESPSPPSARPALVETPRVPPRPFEPPSVTADRGPSLALDTSLVEKPEVAKRPEATPPAGPERSDRPEAEPAEEEPSPPTNKVEPPAPAPAEVRPEPSSGGGIRRLAALVRVGVGYVRRWKLPELSLAAPSSLLMATTSGPKPDLDRGTSPVEATAPVIDSTPKANEVVAATRPRTATIRVLMPVAAAELVVRGEVGRGNPDEWYGPERVIHTPPLGKPMDYLVGSFWTDQKRQHLTRSKELKVEPGQTYEVDLRVEKPSVKEVAR